MTTEADALSMMQGNLASARDTHTEIMYDVYRAQELYDGGFSQDSTAKEKGLNRHTKYAQKDVARVVESSLPDLCSPFVQEDSIVSVEATRAEDVPKAEAVELLINKQWSKSVRKLELVETIARDLQIHGTCFTKCGYGTQPLVETVPINEIFVDPSARTLTDAAFVIQRRKVSVNAIESNTGWFGEHSKELYANLAEAGMTEDDTDYNQAYGRDDNFNFEDRQRQLIEVFEYYGMYDLEDNGVLVPVIGIWSDNTLLRFGPSPYPDSFMGNPFESCVYTRKPYSIYGSGVPEMLETSQSLRQFISSAMVENVENNTVGQTFVEKNFLDPLNKKKLLDGDRLVETNGSPDGIVKGQFVDMPQSVFLMNESLKAEQEELTGISRLNTGMDPRSLNSNVSAAAVNTSNSNAGKRLLQTTRHISEMMERVFIKWIALNQMYLQESMIKTSDGEYVPMDSSMIQGDFDISINVGTAGDKETKMRDLQMMLSLVSTGGVSPMVVQSIIAEMADLVGMPVLSQELRQPPEQDPMKDTIEGMSMQLDMQEKQAKIDKDNAQSQKYRADAMKTYVDTENASYGL